MAGTDFCGFLTDSVPRIQNRSARQKQTENTHILGKKLQRPPVSPYWWNAGWSGSIMKNISIASLSFMRNEDIETFHRTNLFINYSTIALNFSAKLTDRKLSGKIGKIEWNISFVYLDKAKYKSEEAFRAHKVFQHPIKSQGFQNCYEVKTSTWCPISYNTLLIVHTLTSMSR